MNSNNIRLGFVNITLLTGAVANAYIGEYNPDSMQARVMVNGVLIQAHWNGTSWIQVNE